MFVAGFAERVSLRTNLKVLGEFVKAAKRKAHHLENRHY